MVVIIYSGWIRFPLALNKLHVQVMAQELLGNLSEFNHILINNCANLIKIDNAQITSCVISLLGKGFVFLGSHLHNLLSSANQSFN